MLSTYNICRFVRGVFEVSLYSIRASAGIMSPGHSGILLLGSAMKLWGSDHSRSMSANGFSIEAFPTMKLLSFILLTDMSSKDYLRIICGAVISPFGNSGGHEQTMLVPVPPYFSST